MAHLPLLWLSLAFLAGLLAGGWQLAGWGLWLGLASASLIFGVFERRLSSTWTVLTRWRSLCPLPVGVVLAALFLGALRSTLAQPSHPANDLIWLNDGEKVRLNGQITNMPERGDFSMHLQVQVKEQIPMINGVAGTTQPLSGLLQVTIPPGGDWQYGDRVQLEGKPQTPTDSQDFSYKDYLARQGIYSQMIYPRIWLVQRGQGNPFLTALYRLRQRAYQTINRSLPQPEAALLNGILLGLDQDLPADVQQAFRDTGTAHIIAISGFKNPVTQIALVPSRQ